MSNENTSGASEQPPVNEAVLPASEQQQAGDTTSPFEGATLDELFDAIDGIPSGPSPEAEPAVPAEVEPVAAVAESVETQSEEEPAPPADPEKHFRRRLSLNGVDSEAAQQTAAAVELIRTGKAANLIEAVALLQGDGGEQVQTGREEAQPTTVAPTASAKVLEIQQSIEAKREERRQAMRDFDTDKQESLTTEIENLGLDLLRAEHSDRQAAVVQASYNERFEAEADAVEVDYPQAADENSAFSRILSDRVLAARARGDKALKDPAYIRAFAEEVAKDLGIKKGAPAQKAPATPAPARPSRPVGSSLAPGHQTTARLTRQQVQQGINDLDSDALAALADTL